MTAISRFASADRTPETWRQAATVTTLLNFDRLTTNPQGTIGVPDGYGGLQWTGFGVVKKSDAEAQLGTGTGYTTGLVSGGQVAFFGGASATISSGSSADFTLQTVYLTSAFRDNETVTIIGYDDGVQRYSRTVTVGDDTATLFNLNIRNVDTIVFSASGGTPSGPVNGPHIVFDNLRVVTGSGSISGFVFNDRNANGRVNDNDGGLVNRLVYIDDNHNGVFDSGERSTRSAADGSYTLDNLAFGEYDVSFVSGVTRTATTQEIDRYHYTPALGAGPNFYPGLSTLVTPLDSIGEVDRDEGVYTFNLTTPIQLWGNTYSTLYISVNGLIEFDGISSQNFRNSALPDTALGPIIAPFWTDLTFEFGGDLLVREDTGTGQVIVTWSNAQYFSQTTTTRVSFQVIINPDGEISFHYSALGAVPSGDANGVTIGVQGDVEDGAVVYTMGTALPPQSSEIVFTPYLEQTYGTEHVVVDAGRHVTGVDFGSVRIPAAAFGEDRSTDVGPMANSSSFILHDVIAPMILV